jgi:VWA domain-containing protein/aerotolerance regulator-like protein
MIPLAPLYLIGIAAAGIPLVLHLIYRRKAQRVMFSTVRFLRLSNERTAHRRRIQNLLLLLLRSMLFVLLAFAFSQFIVKLTEGSGIVRARAAVVIVVDNSYSMATQHEGRARYLDAQQAALAVLRELHPDDRAAVLFTSGPERRLDPKFARDVQEVQNTINRSVVSSEGGNVMDALKEAQRLLLEEKTELKEIYVLTDAQKLAWQTASKWDADIETALEREQRSAIPIIVFDAGRTVAENLAIRNIRVSGQAFVRGTPITIDADIENSTPEPATAVVGLSVAGEAKGRRKIDVGANATATASFAYQLPESGIAGIEITLPDDELAADNRRHFKLEVKEKIRALIAQDAASAVDFLDQSYFLERALDPSIALGGASLSIIRPDRMMAADLSRAKLADYDIVFLLGVRSTSDKVAAALKDYVKEGGGLVFFAGEDVDPAEYARLFGRGPEPLLPLPLEPADKLPPDRTRFKAVTHVDESHFVFAPFRGLNVLKSVRVYKSARIDLHATTPMTAIAGLADGQPLVLEHSFGRGKVVFVTVTANAAWSNLPVTDVFLPLIHQVVYHVCGSFEETDSLVVGAPYRLNFPQTARPVQIDVRRPDGIEETLETEPLSDSNQAIYAQTFTPGYYTYATRGGVEVKGAFVVNPDTAESRLARISRDELVKHLEPAMVRICSSIAEMQKLVTPLREGVHLRDLFILLVIVAAVFETVISNWAAPRSETKRKPTLSVEEKA